MMNEMKLLTEEVIDFASSLTREERNRLMDMVRDRYASGQSIDLSVAEMRAIVEQQNAIIKPSY